MKKKLLLLIVFSIVSCEAVFIEDISTKTVNILAPKSNTEVPEGTVQFNWENLLDATEYHIQIATPNFTNTSQLVLDSITNSNSISKTLAIGNYEWRVKAKNSGYETGYSLANFEIK